MSTKTQRCHVNGYGYHRLAPIPCTVAQGVAQLPYAYVTIKTDVPTDAFYYLAERQLQFRGVVVQKVYQRKYPLGTLAAQLFGTVGPISKIETHWHHFKGVPQQAIVGQSGLEYQYDDFLRGSMGAERVRVNSLGQFEGYLKEQQPVAGQTLRLSIDLALQRAGQKALAQSIATNPGANGGAFVALDPRSGQVLAMGSNPTFNPSIFTHPISNAAYARLNNPASGFPLINRAIQSAGPTGSTFKPITATAALESGRWLISSTYDDTGQFCLGAGFCLHNAGHAVDGVLNIVSALRVSSDDFFYNLGAKLNDNPTGHPNGGPLQHWAHLYGIGRSTGIDLPGEATGALPSPKELKALYKQEVMCEKAIGPYKGHPKHPASQGGCGIANTPYWTIGYNVNTAVGQGDVQVTPLQLAVAYSALENGGTIVRPHVGMDIQTASGTVLQKIAPPPARHIPINPTYLSTIRQGLFEAANDPGGTSYDVMHGFPKQVYGKTGTAQYNGQPDYGWYACFVPSWETGRPIVIVVTVERGGFGDVSAAPVAHAMLSQWFLGHPGSYTSGTSATL
jgi:penicillin-binding protein 2